VYLVLFLLLHLFNGQITYVCPATDVKNFTCALLVLHACCISEIKLPRPYRTIGTVIVIIQYVFPYLMF